MPSSTSLKSAGLAALALLLLGGGAFLLFKGAPSGPALPATVPLDVWFTSDTSGRIEPCGCFTGQYGGLTRISTTLAKKPKNSLRFEIGNAIAGTEDYQILQFRQLLQAQGKIGYDALNLGSREASLSTETLRSLAKNSPVPLVSANVLDAATREPVVEPWRILTRDGLRIGVIGVVASPQVAAHASVVIENAAEALRRVIPLVKEKADVLICLAFTDEPGLEAIARDFYELPIILGGEVRQPSPALVRVNQSWILATTNQSRALGELHTTWDRATRSLTPATGEITLMHDRIPEDPAIAAFSSAYRKEIRTADLKIDHPGESGDAIPGVAPTATYVGSAACASCHATAYASWEKSGHAHAFESLVRKDSDADPSCISCHVTGFNEPGGYTRSLKGASMVNVGCESCHGPASDHVQARAQALTGTPVLQKMRPVGPGQCVQCHHGEFSRPFKYEEFWPAIQHALEPK
jgi:hypothetical protein